MEPVPDRVAIETPRGDIRVGDVLEARFTTAGDSAVERWYRVRVEDSTFRVPASEAEPSR